MNDEPANQEFCEDQAIRYNFTRGCSYHEILLFLEKQHRHVISYNTLLRRLNQLGLHRHVISYNTLLRRLNQLGLHRRQKNADHRNRQRIEEIVNGPGFSGGYRAVWHTLKMEGTQVP